MRKYIYHTLIPISISILIYYSFINAPFGTYDIWFERIAYGNYKFSELPGSFQALDIPTDLKSYIKYRAQYVGRTPGSVLITYLGFNVLGDNPSNWRICLFILMFLTYLFVYLILKEFRFKNYIIILVLILLPALLSRYFVKTISLIYVFTHLFFLMGLYLELRNGSDRSFKYWKSILGAVLILLSIFVRELQASSILGFFLILIFWHNDNNDVQIYFKINFKRLLPYVISGVLYLAIYIGIINYYDKLDFAYANAISYTFSLEYFSNVLIFILKYIGFSVSAYLGLLIIALAILWVLYSCAFRKSIRIFNNLDKFRIIFGLSVIIPSGFLISLLSHGTGSFTIHIISSFILFATIVQGWMDWSQKYFYKTSFILLFIIFAVLQLLEAKQESFDYIAKAKGIEKLTDCVLEKTNESDIIALKGFDIAEAYTLISNVFIKRGSGNQIIFSYDTVKSNNLYIDYIQKGILSISGLEPTFFIRKLIIDETQLLSDENYIDNNYIVVGHKNYSISKILANNLTNSNLVYPIANLTHKILYGFSIETSVSKQKVTVFGFSNNLSYLMNQ